MKTGNVTWLVPAIVLMGAFWGCENASEGVNNYEDEIIPKPKPITKPETNGITVEPKIVTLGKGSIIQLMATVEFGSETLNWSVSDGGDGIPNEETGGMIYLLTVDENEKADELIIRATLPEDPNIWGEAVVRILGNEGLAVTNGLVLRPKSIMLGPGDTHTFKAYPFADGVVGDKEAEDVSWSVNSAAGSTVTDGTLTVAQGETAEMLTVTATTQGGLSGTAIVTILGMESEPMPVSDGIYVSPQTGIVKKGRTTMFKAYRNPNEEIKSGLDWTVFGGTSATTTVSGGSLSVAEDESAAYLTVRAKTTDGRYGTAVVTVKGTSSLNTIAAIREYIHNAAGGRRVDDPVPLPVNLNLSDTGGNGWLDLLNAINGEGKYVGLDLSDCMLNGTTFDTNTSNSVGKNRIVSLALPEVAIGIKGEFRDFTSIRSVEGKHIESIGSSTFDKCYSLTSMSFPTVKTIGSYAFRECKALTSANLPSAVSIDSYAFRDCAALTSASFPVAESIGDYAFSGCSALSPVSITAVKTISVGAFMKCYSLKSVSLLAAVSIGASAFEDCNGLETVALPVVTKINESAFRNCTKLESVTLPMVTNIGSYTFRNCTKLRSVSLPASLTSVGNNPFVQCANLAAITVDPANNSYKVENGMLLSKDGTTLIGYPSASGTITLSSIVNVNDSAFFGIVTLTSVSLPAAEKIGSSAFNGCTAMTSVSLPAVVSIGISAFYDCTVLESGDFPMAEKIDDNGFYNCNTMTSVSIPNVTSIGSYAFQSCGKLTSMSFPSVTSIGSYILDGCVALTSVSLPAVKSIGSYAFRGCTALISLSLPASVPTMDSAPFVNTKDSLGTTLTIHVPQGSVSAYTTAWNVPVDAPAVSAVKYGENHKRVVITSP